MKALTFPFKLDSQGHVAVATTYPELVRGQLIDVLMTNFMERAMRFGYGSNLRAALFDPTDELLQADAATQVVQRINAWAPRVILESVKFSEDTTRPTLIYVDVLYRVGIFDEATMVRLPVSRFLTEESEV